MKFPKILITLLSGIISHAGAGPGRSTLWEYENRRADPGQCGIVGKLSANIGHPESASCLVAPLPAINDGKCKSWNETEGPRTEWENWSMRWNLRIL